MALNQTKNLCKRFLAAREAAQQGLKIKYFDKWQPHFEEILSLLPETELCTHELFRELMNNPGPAKKKLALVTEKDEPVALAGLRERENYWEPVTTWIIPGILFPLKPGYAGRVLAALGIELKIGWWRWEEPPPQTSAIKDLTRADRYGFSCSEDFEEYWREIGHFKNIRKARNRCKDFFLEVDRQGMTEWTINKWAERWSSKREMPDLSDRILAASDLTKKGSYHTLALLHGDDPVASATVLVHRREVVGQYIYRNPKYDWHAGMTRLIESVFFWSKEMGFEKIDIGGVQDYKTHWAPPNGDRWEFRICPNYLLLARRMETYFQKIKEKVAGKMSSLIQII